MEIIGHRGFKRKFPENTMLSFKKAAEYPIDGIECDVHFSSDYVPVIIHDPTVDRTTYKSGSVNGFAAEELLHMQADREYHNRHPQAVIPSLEELCAWIAGTQLTLHLELKQQEHVAGGIFAEGCLAVLRKHGLIERTVISTFYHEYISEIKRREPAVETALLTKTPFRRGGKYAQKILADGIHIRHGVQSSMYYRPWTKQGLTVRAYNCKTKADFSRCRRSGLTGIITDDPALMTSLMKL
ncbi:glycerophosphodiester phosphodiesterase [Alkalicoccus luteus]|uniref:Glycerophosphodiester phosphodiesterase n=1 Tax=Alkalicoccus luteus TaxID=1237094 RepID=A0A969TTJ2_9BACI|nr:glycerophosphodiester phosphodiesterase family protein [Alkalicoccus luteus]NJP37703.1 glycerophosphodiester phosphodiesterase [Alkalicoccus luteus]